MMRERETKTTQYQVHKLVKDILKMILTGL